MAPTPKPQPGDLIEISRGLYAHWAVYVGGGFVVHFGVPGKSTTTGPGPASSTVTGRVTKEKLEDVAGNNKWKVNNSLDGTHKPRPVKNIVKDACEQARVGKEPPKYNLRKSNCEHFANELRYGVAVSQQVQNAEAVGGAAADVGFFGSLVVGFGALATSAVKAITN